MAILRLVRMVFREEKISDFLEMFEERKSTIRSFPGCSHLELWRETGQANAFFTYSIWETEHDLDHYRYSPFFKETWTLTKTFFKEKAQAWTLTKSEIRNKG
jgi:heme-degrading monooxygenase HmoA